MSISTFHPDYSALLYDWELMRHAYAGERAVKAASLVYLPATPGQNLDGMEPEEKGWKNYQAYKKRAVFPDFISQAVKGMIGVMHNKPPVIELPGALEPLRERASIHGEGLELLLRRINEAQLISGRIGLFLDLPEMPGPVGLPYIATYDAETIINWDSGKVDDPTLQALNMVVLNESGHERVDYFEWREQIIYRVLMLGDPVAEESEGAPGAYYTQGVFRGGEGTTFDPSLMIQPEIRGTPLEQIPFVFINSTDLLPQPLNPPLLELANLCLTIYRGEADYRHHLFMQAQDTLVVIGDSAKDNDGNPIPYRLGAGGGISIPATQGADAKFIGVNSAGLTGQKDALADDRKRAGEIGGQLIDTTSRVRESGDALRIRVAAQTATLNQVAWAGAKGLESILRKAAIWIGANPDEVVVTPNEDFAETGYTAADFLQLTQAKAQGAPISDESLHGILVSNDLTEKDFAEEMAAIEEEKRKAAMTDYTQVPPMGQGNSNQPPVIQ